jgi:hypothetical protein
MDDDRPVLHDPLAELERAAIAAYLRSRGHDFDTLRQLPEDQADALLKEASIYASGRLTEVEKRAHYVDELHETARSVTARQPGRRGL